MTARVDHVYVESVTSPEKEYMRMSFHLFEGSRTFQKLTVFVCFKLHDLPFTN